MLHTVDAANTHCTAETSPTAQRALVHLQNNTYTLHWMIKEHIAHIMCLTAFDRHISWVLIASMPWQYNLPLVLSPIFSFLSQFSPNLLRSILAGKKSCLGSPRVQQTRLLAPPGHFPNQYIPPYLHYTLLAFLCYTTIPTILYYRSYIIEPSQYSTFHFSPPPLYFFSSLPSNFPSLFYRSIDKTSVIYFPPSASLNYHLFSTKKSPCPPVSKNIFRK